MGRLIVFLVISLLTYFYPLIYAYTGWFYFLPKMAGLWFLAFCSGIAYVIEFPRRRKVILAKTLLVLVILIPFWAFNSDLCAKSEDIFYWRHKSEFNSIVEKVTSENLFTSDPDAELSIYHLEGYDYLIARGSNFIAIGVNSMLDNTDGFLYLTDGEAPSFIFEGNLTFIEKIDGNWYKFSTR